MKEIKEVKQPIKSKIVVFDMDGTLYQHDGENGTFKNSSLNKAVIANSVKFVVNREGLEFESAQSLVDHALVTDTIGLSNFMAKRYGITRADYFDVVWNIDPSQIVRGVDRQPEILIALKSSGKRLFLLTGAPRVWMENVLGFLKLNNIFERKFNGEMFGKKDEIFQTLATEFNPETVLSVGDQFDSDIKPAIDLGMQGFQINSPDDLQKLL